MKKLSNRTWIKTNIRRYTKRIVACILSAAFLMACCPLTFAAEENPATPLTPEQVAQMTDEELAAISQEQSDATLNKMAQLFQDGAKQELDEYLAALGFATTYEEYADQQGWNDKEQSDNEPSIQPMWQSDYDGNEPDKQCHETLTTSGFLVYLMARNLLFNGGEVGYRLEDLSFLSKESAQPDADPESIASFFSGHFYNPTTGLNYALDEENTALTNADFYYDAAIREYNAGNRTAAIANLGYSLHYIQDVSVPHHAANKIAGLSNHSDFERLASQMLLNGEIEFDVEGVEHFTVGFYNNCYTFPITQLVHEAAVFSKQFIDVATDKENIVGQKLVIVATTGASIFNTSGVLYKFAKEIGAI